MNDALDIALDRAIDENLLDGFFETRRNEVKDMILSDYDPEKVKQMFYWDGAEDKEAEILKSLGLTKEQYEAILEEKAKDPSKTLKLV